MARISMNSATEVTLLHEDQCMTVDEIEVAARAGWSFPCDTPHGNLLLPRFLRLSYIGLSWSSVASVAEFIEIRAIRCLPLFGSSSIDSAHHNTHLEMLLQSKASLPQTTFNTECISVRFLPRKV